MESYRHFHLEKVVCEIRALESVGMRYYRPLFSNQYFANTTFNHFKTTYRKIERLE